VTAADEKQLAREEARHRERMEAERIGATLSQTVVVSSTRVNGGCVVTIQRDRFWSWLAHSVACGFNVYADE
jgi:hypothetical protein